MENKMTTLASLKIHHVGYLTSDLDSSAKSYNLLGYVKTDVFNDDIQKTKICFLSKKNDLMIELVEPYEENKTMKRLLNKIGNSPYHICYETNNIYEAYDQLKINDWIPLFEPVKAIAFNNRLICYFYCREIGYIELVNKA